MAIKIPQLILLVLLFVFIVFGNTCVLVAIGLSETGRKTRMNFFIMNLAIADLTVGLFHITVDIAERCLVTWYGGGALCKIIRFLQVFVVYASTFMLVSLSIDRVDAIARPMNFTRKAVTVRALIYAAWATSALFALPSFLLNDVVAVDGQMQCIVTLTEQWHWQIYFTLVALSAFVFPALIITVCYTVILVVIWDKGRGFSNTFQSHSFRAPPNETDNPDKYVYYANCMARCIVSPHLTRTREKNNKGIIPQAKIRTIKMTLMIVVMFVLCWCPYFVFNLLDVYTQPSEKTLTQYAITSMIQSLAPLNSAANPIIYGIFSTRICRNLRRIPFVDNIADMICRCRLQRQHSPKGVNQSTTEQTLLDGASSKAIMRRNGNRPCTEQELTNLLPHNFNNGKESTRPLQKLRMNSDNDKKKLKGIYKRRPSGLPLVNRSISEHDILILQTYRIKMNEKIKKAQNHSGCLLSKEPTIEESDDDTRRDKKKKAHGYLSKVVSV